MAYFPIRKTIIIPLSICLSAIISAIALGQKPADEFETKWYESYKEIAPKELYKPDHITKKPGLYTRTDWQTVIDSTWGWGLLKSQKISILNLFWNTNDQQFACFVEHPDYYAGWWDSLYTLYYNEINNGDPAYGVSRGRFAAIMNYLAMALKEGHTEAQDNFVNVSTALEHGIPLLVVGGYGENGHFGAGLTPLPDSTLLVYKTVQNHPLGLEPGDIILGYDGVPWNRLVQDLIDYQLPMYMADGCYWGSGEKAYTHSWLKTAGMNWHLFDSLDVVKYSTGDTLRLSVDPLIGQNMQLWCTEQIEVPGVPMPDWYAGERVTYGIINGTQIGYIYVFWWSDANVEQLFYTAVNSLMNDYETDGLIIDFRGTFGGWDHYANPGFELLFNTNEPLFENLIRCSPSNHLTLCSQWIAYANKVYGCPQTYYDKPIAVLTGPHAISAADCNSFAISLHPMTRFFGKPTNGAFNFPYNIDLGTGWHSRYAKLNTCPAGDTSNYLTRYEIPIDDSVWLTPSDVAQGYDTVVEAAKTWINGLQGTEPDISLSLVGCDTVLDYGQTIAETLTITNNGTRHLFYSLTPLIDSQIVFTDKVQSPNSEITFKKESKLPSSRNDIDINILNFPNEKVIDNSSKESLDNPSTIESQNPPATMGHGGPDDFGYVWIDSDQPYGPSFGWVDISGVGTPVSLGDDSYAGPIDIGFAFPFYENSYTQLYICSNGLITFGGYTIAYENSNIPNSAVPNNFIAPWWDDLNLSAYGNVYYYHDVSEQRFIVSFVGVPKYYGGSGSGSNTFEVILFESGRIELNYLQTSDVERYDYYSATIGIENSDGTDGLEIYYNVPYNVIDSLSIIINTDWLAVSPYSGYVAPGGQIDAEITLSAKYLALGTYTGNIYLDSNDPVDSLIIIPVSLTVTSGCYYATGDVNGSDSYNGLDIIYGVNYFKGEDDPICPECALCPDWHYCGDVNRSCSYNGLDITYGVNYFKGGPDPIPCPDCPPVE